MIRPRRKTGFRDDKVQRAVARRGNIVWPDMNQNPNSAQLLLKGSSTATTVQRIGLALIGVILFCAGALLLVNGAYSRDLAGSLFGVPFVALGLKITSNAFRGRHKGIHSDVPPEQGKNSAI
jgi:hypothetical protein